MAAPQNNNPRGNQQKVLSKQTPKQPPKQQIGVTNSRPEQDRLSIFGVDIAEHGPAILTGFLLYCVLVAVVSPTFYTQLHQARLGSAITHDVVVPFHLEVVDPVETQRQQRRVIETAPRFYASLLAQDAGSIINQLRMVLDEAEERRLNAATDEETDILALADSLTRQFGLRMSYSALKASWDVAGNDIVTSRLEDLIRRTLADYWVTDAYHEIRDFAQRGMARVIRAGQVVSEPLRPEEVTRRLFDRQMLADHLRNQIRELGLHEQTVASVDALANFLVALIPNNIRRDPERELANRQRLLRELPPSVKRFDPGEVAIARNTIIGPFEQAIIGAIGDQLSQIRWQRFGVSAVACALFFGFLWYYATRFLQDTPPSAANVFILLFPAMISLIVGRCLLVFFADHGWPVYAFPSALAGIMAIILAEPRYAMLMVVWTSVLHGLATGPVPGTALVAVMVALASGALAITGSVSLRRRIDTVIAGAKAGAAGIVAAVGMAIAMGAGPVPPEWIWGAIAGGIISGLLVYPAVLMLERLAGVTTDLQLMELTSIKHPLIEQLEVQAPGTYQHTLNVMKLAEAAATAISANALLVRAGVLFHDIGKMDKPKYFSENQVTPEDRKAHDKLSPHMSALIIKEHVRKGILKAREARLPNRVIDFIPEHHGTTTIAYFLHKAKMRFEESDAVDRVNPVDFQHTGPKPQSAETAIVMLADSVDAVAGAKFTGSSVNRDDIRRMVRDVITQKFREEQFDQCPLTLEALSKISDAFCKTLEARYHHRVKYPEASKKPAGQTKKRQPNPAEALSQGSSIRGSVSGGGDAPKRPANESTSPRRQAVQPPPAPTAGATGETGGASV